MTRAQVSAGLFVMLVMLGSCHSDPNSAVVVRVKPAPGTPPIHQLAASLLLLETAKADTEYFPKSPAATPLTFDAVFALDIPRSRSGPLAITIDALDITGSVVASGSGQVGILVGRRADVTIALGLTTQQDGGADDSGTSEAGLAPEDSRPADGDSGREVATDTQLPRDTTAGDAHADVPGLDAGGEGGAGGTDGGMDTANDTSADDTPSGTGGAGGADGAVDAAIDAPGEDGPGPRDGQGTGGAGGNFDASGAGGTGGTAGAGGAMAPDGGFGGSTGGASGVGGSSGTCPPCPSFANCRVQPTCDTSIGQCTAPAQCSVCGNGVLEFSEECDDGNTIGGDHCSGTCKVEFCGDGIVQSKALASLSLIYLARSCGLSVTQDIWLVLNGTEVARSTVKPSCDCEPGIATVTVTDRALLALANNGRNVVEVHTHAEISWAVVHYESPSGPGDLFLVDYGSNGAAQYRRPNLCSNGSQPGGEVATVMTLAGAEQCDDGNSNGLGNDPCSITCTLR